MKTKTKLTVKKTTKTPLTAVSSKEAITPVTQDEINLNRFIKEYAMVGNPVIAYMNLHPHVTEESARVLAWRQLQKVNSRSIMEEMGLDLPHILTKIKEGMQAKKLYTTQHEAIEMEDWLAQHKFTETALKLNKALSNDHLTQNNFQFSFGDNEEQSNG